jgi:hypothetical protein
MVLALLILLPAVVCAAWVFFKFSPANADRKAVVRFNVLTIIVPLLLALAWSVRTYLLMSPTVNSAWWTVISMLGALTIVPSVLGLAAVLRNLVLFRAGMGSRQ